MSTSPSKSVPDLLTITGAKASLSASAVASVRAWLAGQLLAQEYAKLGQGGHKESQIPLRTVFVDLPITREHRQTYPHHRQQLLSGLMAGKLLDFSRIFAKSRQGKEALERAEERVYGDFCSTLLIGGPGQGKSTVGQLASQLYRSLLLIDSPDLLSPRQAELVRSFARQSSGRTRNELALPRQHLLPLVLDLPQLAVWLGGERAAEVQNSDVPRLINYLSELPSAKSVKLQARDLWEFAKRIPVFIVLDGFDEVGATRDREAVVEAARELFHALGLNGNSGKILATTRPQGYAEEFSNMGIRMSKWHLMPLDKDEALNYAKKLVEAKIEGVDMQQQALTRLVEAAREPATQRLLTTPLQVTILTALVQQLGSVPRERWNLFSRYFSYTYDREIERKSYASSILHSHRNHIERIHARVALLLQIEAESVGGAEARMGKDRLEEIILEVLREDEVSEETQERLVSEISKAAQQRLVFLVEPEPGRYGYEIRSLQEFMAAWALTDGRDDDVVQRMGQVARASMFRNVMVFVASRLYSTSSPLRENIGRVCDDLNNPNFDELGALIKAGSLLAVDVIEEGAIAAQPRQSRAIMERAVQLLELPVATDHAELANIADRDNESVLIAAIRHILQQARPSPAAVFGCWNCLLAADSDEKAWAIEILAANIELFISQPSLLSRSSRTRTELSVRLQALLESKSNLICPLDLIDFSCAEREQGRPASWIEAFSASLNKEIKNYRHLMIKRVEDLLSSEAPLAPAGSPPAGWESLAAVLKFETSPNAKTLADALRAVANQDDVFLRRLAWCVSWPLATCIHAADDAEVFNAWANRLDAGELGDTAMWIDAERAWNDVLDVDRIFNLVDEDLPWQPAKMRSSPPIMIVQSWAIRFERKKRGVNLSTISAADRAFKSTKSNKLRQHLAQMCLILLSDVSAVSVSKAVDISAWLQASPGSVIYLANRPPALTYEFWLSLIDRADVTRVDFGVGGINAILVSFQRIPWHPLAVEALSMSLGMLAKRNWRGQIEMEPLGSVLSIWKENAPVDILRSARSVIVGYLCGAIESSLDSDAIGVIAQGAAIDDDRWLEFFAAIRLAQLDEARAERLLVEAARIGLGSVELATGLRERLQGRRSGLELPGVWGRLNLPLPRPARGMQELNGESVSFGQPVHIGTVELSDVGCLKKISITPNPSDESLGQWVVILGPNGTGKSTLLKSLALNLRNLKNPAIWPRGTFGSVWRRMSRGNSSASEAIIDVSLRDGRNFKSILYSDDAGRSVQIPVRNGVAPFPIFAYGCRRGSALGGGPREVNLNSDDGPEIATLFDEESYLVHAETWLVALEGDASKTSRSQKVFGVVVEALKKILELESIEVAEKRLWIREKGGPRLHISSLSDGYLTTAGWFLDLIARWLEYRQSQSLDLDEQFLSSMTGLVLVDEIDLHLHPQWQMEVIVRTRQVLPRMSFWVTTHNPLCLVGAKAEEIWMLSRNEEDVEVSAGKEAPLLLTGGQIYKKYFGIKDIYPDELGRALQRYSFLYSYNRKTGEEVLEMESLAEKLKQHGLLPDWSLRPNSVEGRQYHD